MCGVENWTELWERLPEMEFMQALMAEGLVSIVALRKKLVLEIISSSVNKTKSMQSLADNLHMSYHTIREIYYSE